MFLLCLPAGHPLCFITVTRSPNHYFLSIHPGVGKCVLICPGWLTHCWSDTYTNTHTINLISSCDLHRIWDHPPSFCFRGSVRNWVFLCPCFLLLSLHFLFCVLFQVNYRRQWADWTNTTVKRCLFFLYRLSFFLLWRFTPSCVLLTRQGRNTVLFLSQHKQKLKWREQKR